MFRKVVNAVQVLALLGAGVFVIMLFANQPGSGGAAASSPGGMTFSANCASCHGANGEGAIGPKLAGVVVQAFPNPNDEATFVEHGRGIMPAFSSTLSEAQIRAVVNYTRTELGK
jgi:mono/diheme cytochrome c family protein